MKMNKPRNKRNWKSKINLDYLLSLSMLITLNVLCLIIVGVGVLVIKQNDVISDIEHNNQIRDKEIKELQDAVEARYEI